MQKRSIFYLDDNEDILLVFQVMFRNQFDVRTTSSLAEGLNMLDSCVPDIIISDHRMPEMEGTEFLRRAHQLCPQSLRILLTGEVGLGDVLDEIKEGVVEFFIQKPWDPVEMQAMLERASLMYEMRQGAGLVK
jgi:DNA-binding NtrC family response regulator